MQQVFRFAAQPELQCAIRGAQRVLPCVGWEGCDQSIGSTVSDAIVRSWLWLTATGSSPLGYFRKFLQVVDLIIEPTFCGSRFSTGRLLAIEDFYFYLSCCIPTMVFYSFFLSLLSVYRLVLWGWGLRTVRVYIALSQPCSAYVF